MAAITSAELDFRFSVVTGSAGNAVAGTAAGSLGNKVSSTAWANNATLFDDITGAENAASTVDYRCIFLYNSNSANAYQNAVQYISAEVAGGASIAIGTDGTAASALASASAQAVTIANETTAPAGVTFSSPTTAGAGVSLGSIPNGQVKGMWARRTAANTAALSGDGFTWSVSGDTGSL
jgi:hypothetical protein